MNKKYANARWQHCLELIAECKKKENANKEAIEILWQWEQEFWDKLEYYLNESA